jgi:hypothetical protein
MFSNTEGRRPETPLQQGGSPTLLPIPKAANAIGISYRNLLDAVDDGKVPHYRLGNSRRLVDVAEVIQTMKSQTQYEGEK